MHPAVNVDQAEDILRGLAEAFFPAHVEPSQPPLLRDASPGVEARYRTLVEQIPAVVFMANLDQGIGEAYVGPQIEQALGFTQKEWLEDPVRWYQQIHPADKDRWSMEAAEMFVSGKPLRSAYRVISADRRVIWFHCEAKMVRHPDGRPWFIHGVAFDITELKQTEEALQEERNVISAIVDTVSALVVVLDPEGRIVRFNRVSEQTTGFAFAEVRGRRLWDLIPDPGEADRFRAVFSQMRAGIAVRDFQSNWEARDGRRVLISWSGTVMPGPDGSPVHLVIATGTDITENKRLEKATLEISGREQRRIGQDLHDGLGQHLTGIAFLAKVLEQKLADQKLPEAEPARKIVGLVNDAIFKTRELARGLLPVLGERDGLMSALGQWAGEVADLFHIQCHFRCPDPVLLEDSSEASHLFYIAQEAVNNAVKHAKASTVTIRLSAEEGHGILSIEDDGVGISPAAASHSGIGLHIMGYRAKMVGGSIEISRSARGGTVVTCSFPVRH
jgi:PAS domain S-box-containing protein